MPQKRIDELFQDTRYDLDNCLDNPPEWFKNETRKLETEYGSQISSSTRVMFADQGSGDTGFTTTIVPGEFYMFHHDPIQKWALRYYDLSPFTFVFEAGRDWFRGLNFHYLPYPSRIELLQYLMKYATIKPVNDRTRILIDWDEAKDSSFGYLVQPCEQKYWMGEVRTRFKLIEPRHWALMMMLPCEDFFRAHKSRVWMDKMKHSAEVAKDYVARHGTPEDVRKMRDYLDSLVQDKKVTITRELEEV